MRAYWLHIVENKSPQSDVPSTYLLAYASAPQRDGEGGALPTVHYASWKQLGKKLSGIGIDGDVLQNTKEDLDARGSHTITEVILSDEQLKQLGFTDVAAVTV